MAAIAGSSQSGMESPEEGGSPPDSTGASRPEASAGGVRTELRRVAWAGGRTAGGGCTAGAPGGRDGPCDSGSVGMLLLPLPWRTAPTVRTGRVAV
ncbi:hypothetical protein HS99_0007325 [Kitasatospora aureofaciens]|uniref:Uncharacterized protein n=1 Tax=Kitasatospora aureofaciens TaxID=1894 RepID=A0A1E7N4Y0_KITAU|nr:hypothetical protein HS99_0007325 [Kitasatospora aureofaciens]GGU62978.1 hypothetical protein GCM10010502_12340 [Kitasatospora aureofaciens]